MMEGNAQHPHVAIYKRLIEAFNRADFVTVRSVLDPNIVYTIPGNSPLAGTTHGVDAHLLALKQAKDLSGGTLRLTPKSVLADDTYLVVVGQVQAEREGRQLDSEHMVMFRFDGDRIVEGRTVPVDLYAFDRFWC